jgi:hypothetical protein
LRESHAFSANTVDVWCFVKRAAFQAHVTPAVIVDQYEHDVGTLSGCGHGGHPEQKSAWKISHRCTPFGFVKRVVADASAFV